MTIGEQGVPVSRSRLENEDREALEEAKAMLAADHGLEIDAVTDDDVVEAYQTGGFSEWPAERARRVVRALSNTAGLSHI